MREAWQRGGREVVAASTCMGAGVGGSGCVLHWCLCVLRLGCVYHQCTANAVVITCCVCWLAHALHVLLVE